MLVKSPVIAGAVWIYSTFGERLDGVVEGVVCGYDYQLDGKHVDMSILSRMPYVSNHGVGCYEFGRHWTNFYIFYHQKHTKK
jgi:hypothetical protein